MSGTANDKESAQATQVAAPGDTKFNDAYDRALIRKRLFKDYLSRHQVLDRFNAALEALFESEELPEDPVPFLTEQMKLPLRKKLAPRPTSAFKKSR